MNTKYLQINNNLTLHYEKQYSPEPGISLPVNTHKGPVIKEYLDQLYQLITQAIMDHRRILACRFDLTLPHNCILPDDTYTNGAINRFHKSFKAKIEHDLKVKNSPHRCKVRYARAREISSDGMPHYHLLILLNLNVYITPGSINYEGRNIYRMICEAWASALRIPVEYAMSGVNLSGANSKMNYWMESYHDDQPDNHYNNEDLFRDFTHYYLEPHNNYAALPLLFERASYLCKAHSKQYGNHIRTFETSRI